ncbi:DUF2628 domain-containing protein [Mesorhizobium marinum]|uniref:DUF2628 domain-containing protein n=1 Tax=Mesorhizobium marinum TaxID=3228790 RepID=UPI00346542C5
MAIHVVMEPPGADATQAAERAVIVRDGFAFLAFLVPPLWLAWHRLWTEAILALAASIALTALGEMAGYGPLGAALSLLISLFVGLEGPALRVNALRRRGWVEWGVVEAGNRAEAEIRYLAGDGAVVEAAPAPPRAVVPSVGRLQSGPALGLFDYPGRN